MVSAVPRHTTTILAFTAVAAALAVTLFLTDTRDLQLFHALADVAGIALAGTGFALAWRTRRLTRDAEREEALRQSEMFLRAVTDGSPDPVFVKDRDGRILFANPAYARLLGQRDTDILGRREADLLDPPSMAEPIAESDRDVVRHERMVSVEETFPTPDGHRVLLTTKAPYRSGDGRVVGVLAVARDITRRKQLERELREKAAELASANRAKEQFLATLSHELRTPMNAILGWTEMLLQGTLDREAAAHALDVIRRNARVQVALIDDVLDVGRIASGKLRLELRGMHLWESLGPALETVRPAAAAKQVVLTAPRDIEAPLVADPHRLQQIFANLLSNAVKFSPPGGRVDIVSSVHGEFVQVQVRDQGVGLTSDELSHVFERFWQADASVTKQHAGLGLGLSLVHDLVKLHGGQVRAESAGLGMGATFTVSLPLAAQHAETRDAPDTANAPRDTVPTLQGLQVLVVDDDPEARDLMGTCLRTAGARVCLARSVPEALRLLHESPPDVIISDIAMPSQDGYSLIRALRSLPGPVASRPALAVTAYGALEDRARAMAAGFDRHLPKPVIPDVLVKTVASMATHLSEGQLLATTASSPPSRRTPDI